LDELHEMATVFDERAAAVFSFGGFNYLGSQNWAFSWDGSAWTDLGNQPLGHRSGLSMAYDPILGQSILFAGAAHSYGGIDSEYYDDTWSLIWVE